MTKEEALAKLREQGYEVTPEEAKALEALLSTGELDESALESVVGGISPRFKKALIGAGILVLATAGLAGVTSGRRYVIENLRKGGKYNPVVINDGKEEEWEDKE